MERTRQLFEKIEKYINQSLTKEERLAFENEMAANDDLQKEVAKHEELHRILGDKDTLEFRKKLENISKELQEESNSYSSINWLYLKIAASIVLLIGLGSVLWNYFDSENNADDLYSQYYKPYPVEDVTRGGEKTEIAEVLKDYKKEAYQKVIVKLKNIKVGDSNQQLFLYLGNSYLNVGEEEKAIDQFNNIADTSIHYENSIWYQALAYLRLKTKDSANFFLEKVISYNGIYKKKAEELLREISNNER